MQKILTLSFLLLSITSFGSQIRIGGSPHFQLSNLKSSLGFQGTYTLSNSGDETAKNVFPKIRLDLFEISGKPVDLKPGESHVWKFDEKIPKRSLTLPLIGQFLLRFENNYSDMNLYPFAIPQLEIIAFEDSNKDMSNQMKMALKIKKIDDDQYQAEYEVHNQLSEDVHLKLEAILPKEMELLTPLSNILLKEKASLFGTIQFKNLKGLNGSHYYAYVTAEWENAGNRRASWTFAPFTVGAQEEPQISFFSKYSKAQFFWTIWIHLLVLGAIVLWRFWFLPQRNFKK